MESIYSKRKVIMRLYQLKAYLIYLTPLVLSMVLLFHVAGIFQINMQRQFNLKLSVPDSMDHKLRALEATRIRKDINNVSNNNITSRDIIMLHWTQFHGRPYPMRHNEDLQTCFYKNCKIVSDKSLFNQSDVVIFHVQDLPELLKHKHPLPTYHPPHQKWLLMTQEPKTRSGTRLPLFKYHLDGQINITSSYSYDDDITIPYGWTEPLPRPNQTVITQKIMETRTMLKQKRKLMVQLVSHCNTFSQREDMVNDMKKYVNVDVYGKCGRPCRDDDRCLEDLGRVYKFYLAFENSDCKDYITEKVWENAFKNNMVPVIFGEMTDFKRLLPPNSYININTFSSFKELSEYLNMLDQNNDKYEKYFEWKWTNNIRLRTKSLTLCMICDYVNRNLGVNQIANLDHWFDVYQHCKVSDISGHKNWTLTYLQNHDHPFSS
ncbi:unnamed protein product [Owenia fusiformis]|uniref:Fucosyltransferase n=1 Tax=Owenia fusiformis TaxID=6347 RepID=A0A8J1Y106_OWEFU|nr:unnamed protein product [Owenia fusiformis]